MGTWGTGPFDSDAAMDFIDDAIALDDIRPLLNRLRATIGLWRHASAQECEATVASAEAVTIASGVPSADVPQEIAAFVVRHTVLANYSEMAQIAVDQVRKDSALAKSWAGAPEGRAWEERMADLVDRLTRASKAAR